MVETINILITNGINNIYKVLVNVGEKTIIINNRSYQIDDNYIDRLLQIIYLWDEEYGNNNELDSEEFNIIVKSSYGEKKYHGKGFYPYNYKNLIELIGEKYD